MSSKNNTMFARKKLPQYIRVASGISLMAMGAVALAQSGNEAQGEAIEEVVVTGQRASILSAQDIKRDADSIVDSIVASDIGKLPDRSITEALQRVPGVTVTRYDNMSDPEHFAGEGSGVAVRGLSQVRSELNGRDVFSADGGRALSFDDVPAELMTGVDTYKSPTADMIEGGLGGVVNLRTRMPFDSDGQLLSATVKGNYGDQIEESNGEYSALYSNRWDTGAGEFGVLVNLSTSDLSSRADNIYTRAFHPREDIEADQTVWVPRGVDWRRNDYQRERDGQYLALQWAPNDELELYATAFRSKHEQYWDEAAFFIDGALDTNSQMPASDWVYDENGALISGTLTAKISDLHEDLNGDPEDGAETKVGELWGMPLSTSTRYSRNTSETRDFALGAEWQATERLAIKADLQRVESTSRTDDFTLGLVSFPEAIYVEDLNGTPSVSVVEQSGLIDQSFLTDPANYSYGQIQPLLYDNEGESTAARLDLEYEFENSLVRSVQTGARYSEKSGTNRTGENWSARYQPWNAGGGNYPFPGVADGDLVPFSYGSFQRGNVNVPSSAFLLDPALLKDFRASTDRIVDNTPGGCCGPDWENALDLTNPANINEQEETTQALYTRVNFAFDDLAMPLDGNLGLRYVRTENVADGDFNIEQWETTTGSEEEGNLQTHVLLPASSADLKAKNDYDHLLPSLNLRLHASDNLVFRFAASKALWRPEFWQLKSQLTLSGGLVEGAQMPTDPSEINLENLINQGIAQFTLSTDETNPYLEPMEADQYDLSAEWYFDDNGGMAHLSLFRKDISNYFTTVTENTTAEGFDVVSTWVSNEGSADIQGAEIGFTKFFDFLPEPWDGFGVQANYTYIDSSLEGELGTNTDGSSFDGLPAEGISENSYNLVGMYEKYGFYTRLAWNWRSEYLVSVGPNGWNGTTNDVNWQLPIYNDDYGQLDLSMGYNITDNISVNFEAYNLTKEETVGLMDQGEIGKRHAYTYSQDVRYAASVRVTF